MANLRTALRAAGADLTDVVKTMEETARHLGHLDVLRKLADGRTGE